MKTLLRLAEKPSVPAATAWYLSELGEARGKQELFTKQSPEKLKVLREHAIIESAISSNRIEGVEIETARIGTVVFGESPLRDRNEEEVRGYRNALQLIHEKSADIPVDERTIKDLHRFCRGEVWDAGLHKDKDSDIVERYPDGRSRVRFKTVTAAETPLAMASLIENWDAGLDDRWAPPLILLCAFNLDFLCIHPFRDGNGRASRLLLLLQLYHLGFEVGRSSRRVEPRPSESSTRSERRSARSALPRSKMRAPASASTRSGACCAISASRVESNAWARGRARCGARPTTWELGQEDS